MRRDVAEFLDFQTRRQDQLDRRAATAAALSESLPWISEASCQDASRGDSARNMLDEQQLSTGIEHPGDLTQRRSPIAQSTTQGRYGAGEDPVRIRSSRSSG